MTCTGLLVNERHDLRWSISKLEDMTCTGLLVNEKT